MTLDVAAAQLEALGNPTRLKIYRTLVKTGEGGIAVGQLQGGLSMAASTLSHQVQKLGQVDLVTQERKVTTLLCRANYRAMSSLIGYLSEECCAESWRCGTTAVS